MNYDVVVIGAGPSGIASAIEAKKAGLNVVLLEKMDEHNQTMRKFYKDGKRVDKEYKGQDSTIRGNIDFFDGTKESTLEYFDKIIKENDINIIFKSEVEKVVKNGDIFLVSTSSDTYESKAVIIAIGKMGKPNKPDYKIPLTLNAKINYNANSVQPNEKILVVGGGNSAVEYAIDLSQSHDVTLSYRRDKFSRINDVNAQGIEKVHTDGKLKLWLNTDIESLEDESGNVLVKFKDGKSETFDRIIYAIGGSNPVDFLHRCHIKTDDKGNADVDENNQTSVHGLYLCGDISLKSGGSVVTGFNHAFKVVTEIKNNLDK